MCPAQVAHHTCYYHKNKTKAEILERRQFIPYATKSISDASVPFRRSEFLELMRGRRMFLIGDSVIAGIFTSLLCTFHTMTEINKLQMNFKRLPDCSQLMCPGVVRDGSGEHSWNRGGHVYFRFYDFSLFYIRRCVR